MFPVAESRELASNSASNGNTVNDDDDDVDAMFEKYLGEMGAEEIKALMAMGDGRGPSLQHGDGGHSRGAVVARGDYNDDDDGGHAQREAALLANLARYGEDGSSDDDGMGVEERIGGVVTPAAVAAKKKKKATTKKKAASSSSASAPSAAKTASPSPARAKRSASSASPTAPSTAMQRSVSKTTAEKAPPPSKRSLSKGPLTSTSSASAVAGGTPSVVPPPRPSLLPSRTAAKAPTVATAGVSAATSASSSAPSAKRTLPALGGSASANSSTAPSASASASASASTFAARRFEGTTSRPISREAEIAMFKGIIAATEKKANEGGAADNDNDDGHDNDDEDEDDQAVTAATVHRSEPFRYEAPIKTSGAALNRLSSFSSSQRRDKQQKSKQQQQQQRFGFKELVEAVLTAEERAALSTPEQVSEALAAARIVDLSDRGVSDSDDVMCLDAVSTLYLQRNRLTEIEGLAALRRTLTVLVIAHNGITSLAPVASLEALLFLDASHNAIEALDAANDLCPASSTSAHLLLSNGEGDEDGAGASLSSATAASRLVDLRLEGNPCAPDYALLQRYEEQQEEEEEAEAKGGEGRKQRKKQEELSGLVGEADAVDGEEAIVDEEEAEGHIEYLDAFRAAILAACPRLRYLDGYDVASFAPWHLSAAAERDDRPRLLANVVDRRRYTDDDGENDGMVDDGEEEDTANDDPLALPRGGGGVSISEEAALRAGEAAIDEAMRLDMEAGRCDDDDYDGEGGGGGDDSRDPFLSNGEGRRGSATDEVRAPSAGGASDPAGLSELQARLMDAYLAADAAAPSHGISTASSRPGTAARARLDSTVASLAASSARPGTASALRPSTAKAAAAVAALGNDSSDSSDSDEDETSRAGASRLGGLITDPLAGGRIAAGRVGGGATSLPPDAPAVAAEDRAYAALSDRQRALAKELAVAQRHRDRLAALALMGRWDDAEAGLRDVRARAEERRRRLLFGGDGSDADAAFASSSGSTSATTARGRLQQALLHTKGTSFLDAQPASSPSASASASASAAAPQQTEEMQHSAGYLAALERLRRDAKVVGDINRYKKQPQPAGQ